MTQNGLSNGRTRLEFSFVNEDIPPKSRKRVPHKVNHDVPYHDTKPPADINGVQMRSLHLGLRISRATKLLPDELPDTQQSLNQDECSSSPLLPVFPPFLLDYERRDDLSPCPGANGDTLNQGDCNSLPSEALWTTSITGELFSSSPLIQHNHIEQSSPVLDTMDITEQLEEDPQLLTIHRGLAGDITVLMDHFLRSIIMPAPGRLLQKVKLSQSDDFQHLSQIAPSNYLPGYIESIASQAPFLSRLAASLSAICRRGRSMEVLDAQSSYELSTAGVEAQLWTQLHKRMQTMSATKRLKPIRANSDAVIDATLDLFGDDHFEALASPCDNKSCDDDDLLVLSSASENSFLLEESSDDGADLFDAMEMV